MCLHYPIENDDCNFECVFCNIILINCKYCNNWYSKKNINNHLNKCSGKIKIINDIDEKYDIINTSHILLSLKYQQFLH